MVISAGLAKSHGGGSEASGEVRIYQHSPIIYWWVVWVYGFFCALLTRAQGETFVFGGGKPVLIYPGAWLGLSFTLLMLFVIVASTVRARGINALLLVLLLAGAIGATHVVMGLEHLYTTPPTILLHMNLAFYVMVSSVLLLVWLVVVFFFDRLTYWRFRSSQIERVQRFASALGRAPESYSVMHVKMIRYGDDLLAHKVLGLGIIGLGTGDVDAKVTIVGGGSEHFRIEHVWRPAERMRRIQALMGPKATVAI